MQPIDNTDVSSMMNRKVANLALEWCVSNFGKSRHASTDGLRMRMNRGMKKYYGFYSVPESHRPIININPENHKNQLQFIDTILHEYIHHMQPIKRFYKKLLKEHDYKNHPYEIGRAHV